MSIRIRKSYRQDKDSSFKALLKNIFSEQVKEKDFAIKLYECLCNTIWYNKITNDIYSCSWRYAGGIVANLRNQGENYMNFYSSGEEGKYHQEVYEKLNKAGYNAIKYKKATSLQKHDFTGRL